ncbi:Ribokinase-like protein [Ilyonectria robusta]|uniref:Ribokinase-like protein n=1 Tax=Ilyonectria robusta TaxID=1079257 RepID=UPI001E8DAA23|nr:Ribokinase-like protein [Ilyonectria robusta]KAH8737708.1 Ribokinase-like protein [Ilyonectria robusta]
MLRSSGTAPRNLFTVHRLKSRSNHTPTQPCKLTMPPLPLVRPLVRPAALATGMPSLICRTWVRPFSGVAAARTPRSPCRRLNPTTSGDPSTPILLKLFPSRSSSFPRSSTQLFARQLNTMAPAKEYSLFCLENPLLDIQAYGDQTLLDKYDLKENDAILAEDKHIPLYEDLLNNYDAKLIAGGAAQNSARGAQYILPPNSVVYVGGAGDDKYSAILYDAVKAAGLRVEYRVDPKEKTGRCGAIITGHNRSLCTDLGAANHYDLDHLKKPEIWSLVQNAEVYYVGGFHFTVCPPAIMELAKQAAEHNKTFVLSLSAPFIPQFFKEVVDASAPYWDYVIGNETEAAAYAESHGLDSKEPKDVVKHLANLPKVNTQRKRIAIVTQGTDATLVAIQGEDAIHEFPVHAIDTEKINDTNGAGDAFAGGLLAGIIEGKSLETSIDMGQWLARLSIQELGPS